MRRGGGLPEKLCAACARPFAWRKKWARDWEQVRFCSDACRDGRYARAIASRRDLARETGMSTNRIGIILRHEPPPATVGEVGLLAAAVGRTASAVIAEAEGPVSEDDETMELAAASDSDIDTEVEAQQVEP